MRATINYCSTRICIMLSNRVQNNSVHSQLLGVIVLFFITLHFSLMIEKTTLRCYRFCYRQRYCLQSSNPGDHVHYLLQSSNALRCKCIQTPFINHHHCSRTLIRSLHAFKQLLSLLFSAVGFTVYSLCRGSLLLFPATQAYLPLHQPYHSSASLQIGNCILDFFYGASHRFSIPRRIGDGFWVHICIIIQMRSVIPIPYILLFSYLYYRCSKSYCFHLTVKRSNITSALV